MAKKPKHNPKPWGFLDEFRGEGKLFNAEWPTLNEQFDITVARFPNNKAFEVFTPKHELFTYKEAQTIIKGVANKLYEMGVRHGDKVGLTGKNSPEWAMAYLAIAYAGATIVPVDYTLGDDVIAHLLTFAEAKVLFIDNEKIDRVNIDIPKISLDGDGENSLFGMQSAKSHKIELSSSKDIAAILFTSGTTGTPKGVMLSHENLTSDVWQAQGLMNIYDDDVSTFMNKKLFEFIRDMWHGTHAVKDIKSYINKMENYFYGTKEAPSTYQLKELLKKEIKRLETVYLREIKAQYAALLPTIITDEQTTSLDTLEKLKIQLTNILI